MKTGIDCKGKKWEEIERGRAKDISKIKFNRLQPLFRVNGDFIKDKSAYWLCQCDCGNQIIERATELKFGKVHSCGCYKKELMSEIKSADLTGQNFNYLTVIERANSDKNKKALWKCQCKCGEIIYTNTESLTSKRTSSCGCYRKELCANKWIDLSGQKFNHLLVLNRDYSQQWKQVKYLCLCDCGNKTIVSSSDLKNDHVCSCGCKTGRSQGEEKIFNILTDNNIKFIYNKVYFSNLIMAKGGKGRYDFVLIDSNNNPYRLIEFDGIQHFKPITFHNRHSPEEDFELIKINDKIKNNYAKEHNLPLIRIPYNQLDNITIDMLFGDEFLINK